MKKCPECGEKVKQYVVSECPQGHKWWGPEVVAPADSGQAATHAGLVDLVYPAAPPQPQEHDGIHRCVACGKEHLNCCGMCTEYIPVEVPCPWHCGHRVCAEKRAKAG